MSARLKAARALARSRTLPNWETELYHAATQLKQLDCWRSQGIKELGLCGPSATLEDIAMTRYRDFYWHSVGHWLGMDVHDTHLLGHGRELEPGHVITVEPGLYIPDEPRYGRYAGIGVRIEDDVLVTRDGCDVLSAGVPTARRELETLVGSRPLGLPKA
eukprot:228143-Chlamydomonas_euryale.AAC.6